MITTMIDWALMSLLTITAILDRVLWLHYRCDVIRVLHTLLVGFPMPTRVDIKE